MDKNDPITALHRTVARVRTLAEKALAGDDAAGKDLVDMITDREDTTVVLDSTPRVDATCGTELVVFASGPEEEVVLWAPEWPRDTIGLVREAWWPDRECAD